ncbi:hypothetical protein NQ315_001894 [Exocentrus adspersus]|uniref:SUN domain-containing protein n=1 Tax=Exocentrus adspersus TaxID=1586481 RepID=A0AAV8WCA6_9CUCU|nr:hypothetical protein NQ315_001894 [Exocentrus adspersus]
MELRSSRSRSKTPFTPGESFDKEIIERGNHVERTVTRSTRRTTTVRTNDNTATSTDEVTSYSKPVRRSTRSERNVRKLYRTSDYSSEDGENEVSSTRTISQNEKNQIIEDAKAAANGTNEVSALKLYKKSGRYWDVYPKTDWTYSQHSRDRVELAPGVVAMPNMSRKTIHSVHESDSSLSQTDFINKETNTDSYLAEGYSSSKSQSDYVSKYTDLYSAQPRQLYNNNYDSDYEIYEKNTYTVSRWRRFTETVTRIFASVYIVVAVFSYLYKVQTSWFAKLHKLTSRVMLLDTWLLWKSRQGNKPARLVALCLLPLLLFGGWWLLSSLGSVLYGTYFNATETTITSKIEETVLIPPVEAKERHTVQPIVEEKIIKITETVYVEPPKANEIAAGLSSEQLEEISRALKNSIDINEQINTEEIVQKIIHHPSFRTIINNYNTVNTDKETADVNLDLLNNHQGLINNLRDEINKMKQDLLDIEKSRREDLSKILANFKAETAHNSARFTHQLNRCCKRPIINIESYVNKILTSLLNDAEFLKHQNGLNNYLHTMFVAKQDLELQLVNLTRNLDEKFDSLIEESSRSIMDDVTKKISLELNENINNIHVTKRDVSLGSISEDRIKEIVKSTLAVYDADKTGLVDYAMETMGGQILTTRCTENYHYGKAVVSVLGIPLWYPVNSPRTIITPSINPGECWAFQNFPGFVVIRLSNRVRIEAFSMEHISRLLVPEGKIDSAPKDFEVYGLFSENDKEPVLLGTYTYDYNGEPLQFFPVQSEGLVFEIIEIRIVSNHGNPNYTCLYRFRVHGKLSHDVT